MLKSNPRFKLRMGLALLVFLSLILAACGSTATTAPVAATTAPAAAATTAAPLAATTAPAAAATTAPASAATTAASSSNALAGKPLVIGLINSRTGANSYYGDMFEKGFMIGLEYFTKGTNKIEGREIKVLVEDEGSGDANKGVEAARKLVQQNGAEILVGTPSSVSSLAIAGVNDKELKKIYFSDPAASPALTGASFSQYTFRTSRNTDQDATVGGAYAASLATKSKKIVSLYQDNAFGQGANAGWKEIATKTAGIEWKEVAVPVSETDFTPYIQRILNENADVLVFNWAGTTGAKLYQQMKDNEVFNKLIAVSPVGDAATVKAAGDVVIGSQGVGIYWHQFPKNAENDYLVKAYNEKYKTFPDIFAPSGFSVASAIFNSLRKTAGDTSADKLIPILEGMTFLTPKGQMTFRKEDHQALQTLYLVKLVKDASGKFDFPIPELVKEVSPTDSAPPIRRK